MLSIYSQKVIPCRAQSESKWALPRTYTVDLYFLLFKPSVKCNRNVIESHLIVEPVLFTGLNRSTPKVNHGYTAMGWSGLGKFICLPIHWTVENCTQNLYGPWVHLDINIYHVPLYRMYYGGIVSARPLVKQVFHNVRAQVDLFMTTICNTTRQCISCTAQSRTGLEPTISLQTLDSKGDRQTTNAVLLYDTTGGR